MTALISLLAIAGIGPMSSVTEQIVFSAERYEENLGIVYSSGPPHLYRIRQDGTGLRQLTSGEEREIEPCLSADGKHILFWRSSQKGTSPVRLYSMSLDGSSVESRGFKANIEPDPGFSRAIDRWGPQVIRISDDNGYARIAVFAKNGRRITPKAHVTFSPSGSYALAAPLEEGESYVVVNMETGSSKKLDARLFAPTWVGDDRLIAFSRYSEDGAKAVPIVLLDLEGHVLKSRVFPKGDKADPIRDLQGGDGVLYGGGERNGFHLDDSLRIWQWHHEMSDGGYDFAYLLDFKTGGARYLGEQTIEAVSPTSRAIVGTQYEWVEGYKGPGAAKLCTIHVWDTQTFQSHAIGFRRMISYGACFIPAG